MTEAPDPPPDRVSRPPVGPDEVAAAAERIEGRVVATPLVPAAAMSERTGSTVLIKAEHRQTTGSFKLRGALNTVLALDDHEAEAGVVTASSGNHGIGTATAAGLRGIPCTVYLPSGASPAKVGAIRRLGATIVTVDDPDAAAAEEAARAEAERSGLPYLSPYNHPLIVAGQGTIGVELERNRRAAGLDPADAVVVAVGGGGLISGIATWLHDRWPDTEIIGVSPANDTAMISSIAAGEVIEVDASPTFSDGTAGGLEPGSITFEACQRLVDRWETVTEVEIATAVRTMIDDHHELVEGAAGAALAAAERHATRHPGSTVIAVSCGANVSADALGRMLALTS